MPQPTALDLETTSLDPENGSILAVGTAQEGPGGPLAPPAVRGMWVSTSGCLRRLEALLRGPGALVVHDVRMEGSWAEGFFGVRLSGERVLDTKLLANRVHPGQPASLGALAARYAPEVAGYKAATEGLIRAGRVLEVPREDLLSRVAVDAYAAWVLARDLQGLLPAEARPWLAEDVDLALCVRRIAGRGLLFDEEAALTLKAQCDAVEENVRQGLPGLNPGSPMQVAHVLEALGLVLPRTEKGNPSTDDAVLQGLLRGGLEGRAALFVREVLRYRTAQKMRGTYIEGYARRRCGDGRLRSDLIWPGTFSWRCASSDPNLQNVPPGMRGLLRARRNFRLLEADYRQAELRIAAAIAPEPGLIGTFLAGKDPHGLFAERLFGPSYSKEQRNAAKTGNFQLLYGAGPRGFQKMLLRGGIYVGLGECSRIHRAFWHDYPGFGPYVERQYATLRAGGKLLAPTAGYVWSLEDGFLRHPGNEEEALRSVGNAPIQSVPPRWCNRAALAAEKEGIVIVLHNHDALLAEVPEAETVSAATRLKEIMEATASEDFMGGLPVPVELKVGETWGAMRPLKEQT